MATNGKEERLKYAKTAMLEFLDPSPVAVAVAAAALAGGLPVAVVPALEAVAASAAALAEDSEEEEAALPVQPVELGSEAAALIMHHQLRPSSRIPSLTLRPMVESAATLYSRGM
jgi:hypothetical protein